MKYKGKFNSEFDLINIKYLKKHIDKGTTLPESPQDGQMFLLTQDSGDEDGYVSGTYQWNDNPTQSSETLLVNLLYSTRGNSYQYIKADSFLCYGNSPDSLFAVYNFAQLDSWSAEGYKTIVFTSKQAVDSAFETWFKSNAVKQDGYSKGLYHYDSSTSAWVLDAGLSAGLTEEQLKTGTYTLTNKTIDAENNTISNITAENMGDVAGNGLEKNGKLLDVKVKDNSGLTVNDDGLSCNTVDDLETDSSTDPLSAKQGKVLQDKKIDTAGTGLSKTGTTLNHSNSITVQTTAKMGKITYDAQGHITDFTEVHLYQHNVWMGNTGYNNVWGCTIINTDSTQLKPSTIAAWLKAKGFTAQENPYMNVSGVSSLTTVYVATSSGGAVTSSKLMPIIVTGIYSTDGTNIRTKNNYSGYSTWNDSSSYSDTVLQIF